ncbi:MAG: hypothetical protein ACI8ZB_000284 [Desulforhopalus sp.]|jgi:hypothetical protein
MRCPKCGYISFDLVDECLKCKKNIKSTSEVLQGAVLRVPPPSFLKFRGEPRDTHDAQADDSDEISPMDSGYVDDDSDFMSDEIDFSEDEIGEIEITSNSFEDNDLGAQPSVPIINDEFQEGEIEVDLSQFEEVSDPEAAFLAEDEGTDWDADEELLEISVPDELSDMSDLDPPNLTVNEDIDDLDLDLNLDTGPVDLDLDDLNFDLALDDIDTKEGLSPEPVQETVLALDDIDFSDALSEESGAAGDSMDMDGDLNFDLDLGGLSIHKDV